METSFEEEAMKREMIDPFFNTQPSLDFVEELRKPVHGERIEWFDRKIIQKGEVSVRGIYIINEFPDRENLLQTALDDIDRFLALCDIKGDKYPVKLVKGKTECFEAYHIYVGEEGCILEADDTEGIRRALIYLEDELLRRGGAILPLGVIKKRPWVRERITRGFFSPTNRPPKCVDELMDDVDYYPDEYLNRLAHDGANGLWIYTYFSRLVASDCFSEYGIDADKRIRKLKLVVEKCKKYGIKVWIFGVEPLALKPEMAARYPDAVGGMAWNGERTICTYSERGAEYCIEATRRLLEQVPELGGIIDITYGERPTTCASLGDVCQCPRCKKYSRSEILAHNIDLLKEGIRRAGSKADFVSWTYAHRMSPLEEIQDYVRHAPTDVMLMENFEDAGYTIQLGKTRQAMDYWLSYVGPSQMFEGAAQTALEEGKNMFAKMQVCCSHELATVPYIPVPGILFDKYSAANRYEVKGVMQCWYFGNYPSLMSKAAGELAFWVDFTDKNGFLEHLAGIYYGNQVKEVVKAWTFFENGYKNYPVNIMFSYYGPMHDGVVWELSLIPKNKALPRSWLLQDKPDGDRIRECLQSGHTLDEAISLTEAMKQNWSEGMMLLPKNGPKEQVNIAKALSILFSSGNNILRFYSLREQLETECSDAEVILDAMEDLVEKEIANSRQMLDLCKEDTRLGYHSEAEGYKFFPRKLEHRIRQLEELRRTEFIEARINLSAGKPAIDYYQDICEKSYQMIKGNPEHAEYVSLSNGAAFRVSYDKDTIYIELVGREQSSFILCFEYRIMWPAPAIVIEKGEISLEYCAISHQSVFGDKIREELDKYVLENVDGEQGHYLLKISRKKAGWTEDKPLKLRLIADELSWIEEDEPVCTLGKSEASPGQFGWLLP